MQRSTNNHHQQTGTDVKIDVTRLGDRGIELFYSWIEIWLFRNCRSGWCMETLEFTGQTNGATGTFLQITFDDVREALYFKLSSEYLQGQNIRSEFLKVA